MKLSTKLSIINEKFGTDISCDDVWKKMGEPAIVIGTYVSCYFDVKEKEIVVFYNHGNTSYNQPTLVLIEVYSSYLWSNSNTNIGTFVNDSEWKEMQKIYGDDADCTDMGQINEIFGDFDKRFYDFLHWNDNNIDDFDGEIKDFERELNEAKE